VATYIGHPEFYGPKGVGLKGAIFMAPPNFNIAPVTVPPPAAPATGGPVVGSGAGCNGPTDAGRGAGGPGGGRGGGGGGFGGKGGDGKGGGKGGGFGGRGPVDPAQSNLPGLQKVKIGFFLGSGELDPATMTAFNQVLKEELCKAGNCPTLAVFKDHSHMSEVFSPNTADDSVTGPILKWMKSVK
jgi:hypothetical protein